MDLWGYTNSDKKTKMPLNLTLRHSILIWNSFFHSTALIFFTVFIAATLVLPRPWWRRESTSLDGNCSGQPFFLYHTKSSEDSSLSSSPFFIVFLVTPRISEFGRKLLRSAVLSLPHKNHLRVYLLCGIFSAVFVNGGGNYGVFTRIVIGRFLVGVLVIVNLVGLLVQSVFYYMCKSYHHQGIDKIALHDHLGGYLGEYVPLKSSVQMENLDVWCRESLGIENWIYMECKFIYVSRNELV